MRYRDVATAIEWLRAAFGFDKHRVVVGDDGAITVAELSVGANMIMLLPVGGTELDRLMKQPDEIGGAETQSCYLVVEDADLFYSRAKAAGAELVVGLRHYANGGRGFSCRDPEGHIWTFGTYDPWKGKPLTGRPWYRRELIPPGKRNTFAMAAMVALTVAVATTTGWMLATLQQTAPSADDAAQRRAQQALDRAAQQSAELAQERSAREAIERAAQRAREQLARGESAREAAERAARQMETQLKEERRAKEAAERAAGEAQAQLVQAQGAEKSVAQPARAAPAPTGQLFSSEDLKRVAALADEKQLPLPSIRIRKPAGDVPDNMRRFVGVWVSDSGFEKTGRQYMLIVTKVLPQGQATGFHIVGPPRAGSAVPARAAFYPLVGRIAGNKLLVEKANLDIVGVLSSRNELDVTEAWKNGSPAARVLLKPVWRLVDAERTTKQ